MSNKTAVHADRSGDGTLRQGEGKRARGNQPWKKKASGDPSGTASDASAGDAADLLLATIAEKKKSKEEAINDAIAGELRKRDEKSDDTKVGVVTHRELMEIKEDRLKNRILFSNPVCLLTTVEPRAVRGKPTTTTAVAPSLDTEDNEASSEDEETIMHPTCTAVLVMHAICSAMHVMQAYALHDKIRSKITS